MILKPVEPGGINNVEILTLGWGGGGGGGCNEGNGDIWKRVEDSFKHEDLYLGMGIICKVQYVVQNVFLIGWYKFDFIT